MAKMTFKGESVETLGDFPKEGSQGAPFTLVNRDLQEISLEALGPKKKILNIFVSLDTSVCAVSIEKFAQVLGQREDVVLLNISMDLPFAASRFCQALHAHTLFSITGHLTS